MSEIVLEQLIKMSEEEIDCYLEVIKPGEFIDDCKQLMKAYSDDGVIDRAVELLQSCHTKEESCTKRKKG